MCLRVAILQTHATDTIDVVLSTGLVSLHCGLVESARDDYLEWVITAMLPTPAIHRRTSFSQRRYQRPQPSRKYRHVDRLDRFCAVVIAHFTMPTNMPKYHSLQLWLQLYA